MLQNEYLVAKISVDTAENEPSKVCRSKQCPRVVHRDLKLENILLLDAESTDVHAAGCNRLGHDTSLFPRLVLGCINTDFCNQILILQHFSRSTK